MFALKQKVFHSLLAQLHENLRVLAASANAAHDEATNPESKAENKYDTRALEASYLAGAQSERAEALKKQIDEISSMPLLEKTFEKIENFSLCKMLKNDEETVYFLTLPYQGGLQLDVNGIQVKTVTGESPLGKKLLGKKIEDFFELKIAGKSFEYEVIEIH